MVDLTIKSNKKVFKIKDESGDTGRTIEFCPSDTSIMSRLKKSLPKLREIEKRKPPELPEDDPLKALDLAAEFERKMSEDIKAIIDGVFGAGVSAGYFGNISPLTIIDGEPAYRNCIETLSEVVKNEAALQRKKYTGKYVCGTSQQK